MVVSYTVRGSEFVADKPSVWSNRRLVALARRNYDLAPDGRVVLLVAPAILRDQLQPETHVNLLLNFLAEMQRRVSVGSK